MVNKWGLVVENNLDLTLASRREEQLLRGFINVRRREPLKRKEFSVSIN